MTLRRKIFTRLLFASIDATVKVVSFSLLFRFACFVLEHHNAYLESQDLNLNELSFHSVAHILGIGIINAIIFSTSYFLCFMKEKNNVLLTLFSVYSAFAIPISVISYFVCRIYLIPNDLSNVNPGDTPSVVPLFIYEALFGLIVFIIVTLIVKIAIFIAFFIRNIVTAKRRKQLEQTTAEAI